MMQPVLYTSDMDLLFDLFNEDFTSEDMEDNEASCESDTADDNTDDTSSESSGSSGHSSTISLSQSPPFHQLSTYYPSPPSVVFAPNPLSSFTCEATHTSNKRTKTEDKLMRNRESANKSRLKRKNEKSQLEETVAALSEQVRALEMENNALQTDNTTLSQHNFFLQELLKQQQHEHSSAPAVKAVSSHRQMSALSGISMLCVVFSVSFFSTWLPSSMQSAVTGSGEDSWSESVSSSGRVLLSVDDDYDSSVMLPSSPSRVALHYVLILCSMFLFYFYIQYDSAVQRKSSRLLPS